MSGSPLVSVIIPVYKVEPYLCDCVDSVLAQTYANLEIILVDDGSPDGCPQICDEYAAKDSRVRVLHKKNGGLSDARNAGMKVASGEYWTFVDSDDVIHPQMVEALIKPLLNDKSLKISAGGFEYFHELKSDFTQLDGNVAYKSLTFKEYIFEPLYVVAWGKIYHRSLFDTIEYPKGRFHEDEFVTYKLCYKAERISVLREPLYMYRQREGSIMAHLSEKRIFDSYDAMIERIKFFEDEALLYDFTISNLLNFYENLNTRQYQGVVFDRKIVHSVKKMLLACDKKKLRAKTRVKVFIKVHLIRLFALRQTMALDKKDLKDRKKFS